MIGLSYRSNAKRAQWCEEYEWKKSDHNKFEIDHNVNKSIKKGSSS